MGRGGGGGLGINDWLTPHLGHIDPGVTGRGEGVTEDCDTESLEGGVGGH